jgi:hypothetical protein
MAERSRSAGLPRQALASPVASGPLGRQDLERDLAAELGIGGGEHPTHASAADLSQQFVATENGADLDVHREILLLPAASFVSIDSVMVRRVLHRVLEQIAQGTAQRLTVGVHLRGGLVSEALVYLPDLNLSTSAPAPTIHPKSVALTESLKSTGSPSRPCCNLAFLSQMPPRGVHLLIDTHGVTSGFFEVFHPRLVEGRYPTSQELDGAGRVVVVGERLARAYWPNQPAVGQTVLAAGNQPFTVVGVVSDGRYGSWDTAPRDVVYGPYRSFAMGSQPNIVLKTSGASASALDDLLQIIAAS